MPYCMTPRMNTPTSWRSSELPSSAGSARCCSRPGTSGDTAYYVATETTITNETINESVSSITIRPADDPDPDNTSQHGIDARIDRVVTLLTLVFAAKAVMEFFETEEEFES